MFVRCTDMVCCGCCYCRTCAQDISFSLSVGLFVYEFLNNPSPVLLLYSYLFIECF